MSQQSVYHPFEWLLIAGSFGAFFFSFGTGSNDVANAFATSVGAGMFLLQLLQSLARRS